MVASGHATNNKPPLKQDGRTPPTDNLNMNWRWAVLVQALRKQRGTAADALQQALAVPYEQSRLDRRFHILRQ